MLVVATGVRDWPKVIVTIALLLFCTSALKMQPEAGFIAWMCLWWESSDKVVLRQRRFSLRIAENATSGRLYTVLQRFEVLEALTCIE